MKRITLSLLLIISLGCTGAWAQDEAQEKAPAVPALDKLSELTMDAMHGPVEDADMAALAALAPKFKDAAAAVQAVKLPEYYADVSADFDHARAFMTDAVNLYQKAADKKDSAALLAAMLKVHDATSRLEAALEGICYEVVVLHDVIAPLQHRALPDEDWGAMCAAVPVLGKRIADVRTAVLPAKHADKKDELMAVVDKLAKAFGQMESACRAEDREAVFEAFAAIHDHFHDCIMLFQ